MMKSKLQSYPASEVTI